MRKIERLMNEAEDAASFRGHTLYPQWIKFDPGLPGAKQTSAWNSCKNCGKQVTVIVNPLPNQIDIGGEAVALGCKD